MSFNKNFCGAISFFLFAGSVSFPNAMALESGDYEILLSDVALRPDVTCDINLKVFVNELSDQRKVLFVIHGNACTANTMKPLVKALVSDDRAGPMVSKIIAIDMPGRGGSGLPTSILFGHLTLDHYTQATMVALERLKAEYDITPDVLIGFSQGGLIIQMLQQVLVGRGTSLREEFGIRNVVLMAPGLPREIPWAFTESPTIASLIEQFAVFDDPLVGPYVSFPPPAWIAFFFTKPDGNVASIAPSPEEVVAEEYISRAPFFVGAHLTGLEMLGFERTSVSSNTFDSSSGTELSLIAFSQDTIVFRGEHELLYEHLTGDTSKEGFVVLEHAEAVHGLPMSDAGPLTDIIYEQAIVLKGDVTGGDEIDLADVTAILSYLFLGDELMCPDAADVNADGVIDIADAVYLVSHLFLEGPAPK